MKRTPEEPTEQLIGRKDGQSLVSGPSTWEEE
jgi:hypothetical protein